MHGLFILYYRAQKWRCKRAAQPPGEEGDCATCELNSMFLGRRRFPASRITKYVDIIKSVTCPDLFVLANHKERYILGVHETVHTTKMPKLNNTPAGGSHTMSVKEPNLLGVDGALNLTKAENGTLFSKYVNSGLKTLLSVIGFDRGFVKGDGVEVYDQDGQMYLDFLGGYGSLIFGHNPKHILDSIEKVSDRPIFLQTQVSPLQAALAHDLAEVAPGDLEVSFFCNSGTEAVESALKLARGAAGNGVFVHCSGAFHGKTLGALSVGGREKYKTPFAPLLSGTVEIPFGDAEALEKVLKSQKVAAFIFEPIQGEGGVIVYPEGYLRKVRDLTSRYGALLIADEVQTGFGRTGTMFACDHEQIAPDILCLAKALGGGVVPIGATVATRRVWEKAYGGLNKAVLHTSTFGGGARACAAALATIEKVVHDGLAQRADELGAYFLKGLGSLKDRYKLIHDVRGMGLLIGVEFKKPVSGFFDAITAGSLNKVSQEYFASMVASTLFKKHHIITAYTLNNPNVMRLEPPLTVTKEQINYVLNAMEDAFQENRSFFSFAASMVKGGK